jgi:hypothetical protein
MLVLEMKNILLSGLLLQVSWRRNEDEGCLASFSVRRRIRG